MNANLDAIGFDSYLMNAYSAQPWPWLSLRKHVGPITSLQLATSINWAELFNEHLAGQRFALPKSLNPMSQGFP